MNGNENQTDEAATETEKEKDFAAIQEELRKITDTNSFEDIDGGAGNSTVNLAEKEIAAQSGENAPVSAQAKKIRYLPVHILAFAIPFALMGMAFSTIKIFPFGDRQIMVVDSWHQYYPFLQELQYKLTHGGSLLYSWNTGAGTNFLSLMSYYASTPLYLFSVFFPEKYLREFMALATVVKIACSGLFFSIYLRGLYKENKKYCSLNNGFAIIGFSTLYAVSAYAVGYYWCIMWLDCMALLPLVILGLERLIDGGKFKLYIITLGITVICNYYIAIFVCEFIAVYYVVLYVTKIKKPSVWGFVTKTAEAVGASIIGVGLSMFILLPTFLWFSNTGNAGSTFSRDINTYNSILDIITNLLPNTAPNQRAMAGLPNIACGLLTVIMAGMYFLNSKIKLKEKLAAGVFLVFMLFCFNLNILDYYWHGMHFPNEIPYRQSFVFTFVLVTLAYKSYANFDGENIKKGTVMKFLLCVFGYLIIAEQWYKAGAKKDVFDFKVFYVSIAILVVYMAVILLYKHGKMAKTYLAVILMFAMIFEGGMSAIKGAAVNAPSDRTSYPPSKEGVQKAVAAIYDADEDLFFRLEMSRWYTTNDPALYRYRGISQFSSEANSRFARTLELLGIAATIPSNRFLYSSATPVFNSLMSIKYLMAREETAEYNVNSVVFDEMPELRQSIFETTYEDGGESYSDEKQVVNVYQNKYWLPLGFVVSEDAKETDMGEQNIFALQNELMKKATGITGNIFENIEQTRNTNDNFSESRSRYGVYSYHMTDKSQKGTANHVYTSEVYQQVYMYIKSTRSAKAYVSTNGISKSYEINRGVTIDCGSVYAGQEISVSFDIDPSESGTFYIFVAGFDEAIFKSAYDTLNAKSLSIEKFSDTNIKGKINAGDGGIFFTSIPYDKGWNLKIDGKKVETNPMSEAEINDVTEKKDENEEKKKNDAREIKKITDGFVTAPIDGGEHTIELYYITEGLVPGAIISLLCVLIILALELLALRKKRNKKGSELYVK